MSTTNLPSTHFGHAPAVVRSQPEESADMLTDIANVAAIALREQSTPRITHDDDVTVEIDGDDWVVTIPYTIVRVKRSRNREFPDQIATWAAEEVGLSLLAASRATGPIWRDMQRVAKS